MNSVITLSISWETMTTIRTTERTSQNVGEGDTAFMASVTSVDILLSPLAQVAIKGGDDVLYNDPSQRPERICSDCGTGWELLAAAIIEKACYDYRKAILHNDRRRQKEIEHFLRSNYFNTISTINPKKLINGMREKYEAERRRTKGKKDGRKPGKPKLP